MLSLPPLIFALAGSIGYVFAQLRDSQIDEVRNTVLDLASQALTPQTVDKHHRADAQRRARAAGGTTWSRSASSSRCGRARGRSTSSSTPSRSCTASAATAASSDPGAVVPALRARHGHRSRHDPAGAGRPDAWSATWLPERLDFLDQLYWPTVVVLGVCFLATLYHVSVPVRTALALQPARRGVHDVLLGRRLGAAAVVLVGTAPGVDLDLRPARGARSRCCCGSTSLSIAVLIGAALNAAFDQLWPQKEIATARMELLRRLSLDTVLPWRGPHDESRG